MKPLFLLLFCQFFSVCFDIFNIITHLFNNNNKNCCFSFIFVYNWLFYWDVVEIFYLFDCFIICEYYLLLLLFHFQIYLITFNLASSLITLPALFQKQKQKQKTKTKTQIAMMELQSTQQQTQSKLQNLKHHTHQW